MRSLSPEEQELWGRVTASIRPLSREAPAPAEPEARPPEPPALREAAPVRPSAQRAKRSPPPASAATLDGSWDKRLRSGTVSPDRTLDLHGMDLETAWQAIDLALERSVGAGDRVLLLITGHARPGEPPILRGRIRAAVHDWLAASRHASAIAAVRPAHRRHGGGGSLYIVLRRPR